MEEKKNKQTTDPSETQNTEIVSSEVKKDSPNNPIEFDNLPDDMPAEVKQMIVRMGMMQTSTGGSRPPHPLFEKFTDDHIHKYLDYTQKDDDNEFSLRSSNRWFQLVYILIALGFFSFLIIYLLPNNKALLTDIIKLFVSFAGGVGSGYGLKSYFDKKK